MKNKLKLNRFISLLVLMPVGLFVLSGQAQNGATPDDFDAPVAMTTELLAPPVAPRDGDALQLAQLPGTPPPEVDILPEPPGDNAPDEQAQARVTSSADIDIIYAPLFPVEEMPSDLISLSLEDVPVADVVNMFARTISEANIVVGSNVLLGTVSVSIKNVHWEDALNVILDSVGLAKIHNRGNIYTIVPKSELESAPLESVVYALSYMSAEEIIPVAKQMCVSPGSGVFPGPGNVIVVKETADRSARILESIAMIDQPREQVFIEAKFVELNADARESIGIDWSILEGYRVGITDARWTMEDARKSTRSRGDVGYQYDIYGNQVSDYRFSDLTGERIQAGTFETWSARPNREEPFDGQRWDGTPAQVATDARHRGRAIQSTVENQYVKTLTDIKSAILSPADFSLVLSALRQNDGVKIVSNPKIIVLNEETATIDIGTREPNISTEVITAENQPTRYASSLNALEPYFQFGISLRVTPTVNTMSNITVRIEPTLTRKIKDKLAPDGNTFPERSTKTIRTLFSLSSGRTVAIGGLTEVDNRDLEKKVPVLGSIPVLGRLFSHSTKQHSQTETMIFVTVALAEAGTIELREGLPAESQLTRKYMRERETDQYIYDRELDVHAIQQEVRMREEMEKYRKYLEKLQNQLAE